MSIDLPISKSIANRILILQAVHGDPLLEVSSAMPDDVRLLHDVLESYILSEKLHRGSDPACSFPPSPTEGEGCPKGGIGSFDLHNCGTAMRFLTAYFAQLPGCRVELTGCLRMRERPIGQLVDALRARGAHIVYKEREGFPPLYIEGRDLGNRQPGTSCACCAAAPISMPDPLSTQFVSALLLTGFEVQTNSRSPYIAMTRHLVDCYTGGLTPRVVLERDWSSAAFWLERWALGLCPMPEFPDLPMDSLQGDRVALDIFRRLRERPASVALDFSDCPDLYPAVAIACALLGISLAASGTASLRLKESDRIAVVDTLIESYRRDPSKAVCVAHDHRIAMAAMAADIAVDDEACVSKSYPQFIEQLCASRRL